MWDRSRLSVANVAINVHLLLGRDMLKSVTVDDLNELLCPSCGGEYLHHYRIEVSDRGEDDDSVLFTSITTGTVPVGEKPPQFPVSVGPKSNPDSRNPSARRQGLRVIFWCEGCAADLQLMISQHKGNTFVEWDVRTTLHGEIAAALEDNDNKWMTVDEIASAVNRPGRYEKTVRAPTPFVSPGQIRLRARNHPDMFEIDGAKVRLWGET